MNDNFVTTTEALKAIFKQRYSDFIVEEIYIENGEEKKCEVKRFNIPFSERGDFYEMVVPKENTTENLIVELEKINTETTRALQLIARGTSVSHKRIGYAGLKDKRGITCQRISLFKPNIEKLQHFGVKGIELRNPSWGERIELGDLKGNNFTITLRGIEKSEEEVKSILEKFFSQAQKGLPNYFGNQRFGGKRQVTHKVGKLLLQEKYKEAIMLYLTETYAEEKVDMKNARINLSRTLDFARALKEFPREARQEKAILNVLVKEPNNFTGAFGSLPKKMRYLFVHAYQSYIFNKIIEKRIDLLKEKWLNEISGDILEDGVQTALLPGFESTFSEGKSGEIEKKVLDEERMNFEDFKARGMGEISSKGMRKAIAVKPENFNLIKICDDEFNEGKKAATFSFFLSKGNYATTIMRELIKEEIF